MAAAAPLGQLAQAPSAWALPLPHPPHLNPHAHPGVTGEVGGGAKHGLRLRAGAVRAWRRHLAAGVAPRQAVAGWQLPAHEALYEVRLGVRRGGPYELLDHLAVGFRCGCWIWLYDVIRAVKSADGARTGTQHVAAHVAVGAVGWATRVVRALPSGNLDMPLIATNRAEGTGTDMPASSGNDIY